jgi:hypothetical protein
MAIIFRFVLLFPVVEELQNLLDGMALDVDQNYLNYQQELVIQIRLLIFMEQLMIIILKQK